MYSNTFKNNNLKKISARSHAGPQKLPSSPAGGFPRFGVVILGSSVYPVLVKHHVAWVVLSFPLPINCLQLKIFH